MTLHKDLEVWKRAVKFVTRIYEVSQAFPQSELYGLTSQMRRAAVSIPSNISEGAARHSTKEYLKFLYVSLGSSSELEVQLIISNNLGFLNNAQFQVLSEEREEISKMISGLISGLKQRL